MNEALIDLWRPRIEVVHKKIGRTLVTGVLHVAGEEIPPHEVLLMALADWMNQPPGQVHRRPDENGRQVYWVNILP